YMENSDISKSTREQVFLNIVEDLEEAKELLEGGETLEDRTQVDVGTVIALLARCYLYLGDWPTSETMASKLIQNSERYVWETDLEKVFLKNSTSTIWQLSPLIEGNATHESGSY